MEVRDCDVRSTFCNVINELQVKLTREQVHKMWSILTKDQLKQIRVKFEKDPSFWY